ncbi:MAG: GH92 family glycosyl hydrolase [Acidobacteria bacterium]|nr:GH92 family glycosyl hydrolase [Acidobacteriota bacterium]
MKSKPFISASFRLGVFVLLTALCSQLTVNAQTKDYARYVNPFIGTGGHGHTFPGATVPFGMVQLSPDTRIDNWDGSSGYHYSDDIIYGFSMTHLSGTGIPDGCDILLMPMLTEGQIFIGLDERLAKGYASKFSHANEIATPGYYSVKLANGIRTELTSTARVGLQRYTFPRSGDAYIYLDLAWRDKKLDAETNFVGDRRVEGFRRSSSWAKDQTVYFIAEFSQPINGSSAHGTSHGGHFADTYHFTLEKGGALIVKVAISYVSIEGARKNLAAELPGWDFDKVRRDAKAAWNKELSKIEVSGGTPEQTTNFYTALYHTAIQPNVFNDVDGKYRGHDGKVHQLRNADALVRNEGRFGPKDTHLAEKSRKRKSGSPEEPAIADEGVRVPSEQYTVFSLWDTFRAAHPLYTIIDEKRTADFINSFIRMYEQGGRLPVWELWGEETDTMIGYHAVPVIADAMAKGIKGFDYEKAYEAAIHSAELDHFGLAAYKKRGYISMEDENESVSKTLEYAYDDWCIAQMARIISKTKSAALPKPKAGVTIFKDRATGFVNLLDAYEYDQRARSFENLFDPSTGFMRPKRNGGFVSPFSPNEVTFHFTEGNSWVYTFFVPQFVDRLEELMGGRTKFAAKLDELFTTSDKLTGRVQPDITGLIGQYAHGNEPSHHIAYLYDYAGEPWKTQKLVRQILDEFYKPTPDGLIGNEDCGQMSAWYILSASGFYPTAPGNAKYDLGTPIFKEMKYHLENGKTFTVNAPNVSSKNIYVASVKLNGKPYRKTFITHGDIAAGGTLEFEMSAVPVKDWFTEFSSTKVETAFEAVPYFDGPKTFEKTAEITLHGIDPKAEIFSTIETQNGIVSAETLYTKPIKIDATSTITAYVKNGKVQSKTVTAKFIKKPNDWTVSIASKYSRQYDGGGDEGLIDGIRGTVNFASGEWQGYQGQDFEATIDLQRSTRLSELGGGFLQVARSWIWMPTKIEFEVSSDNVNFRKVAEIVTDLSPEDMTPTVRDYVTKITPVTARYVRVHAKNLGKIPAWHPGAGYDAYIFVDEIIIR